MLKVLLSLTIFIFVPLTIFSQQDNTDYSKINIFVTPYYNSDGLKINIGRYSKELALIDEKPFIEAIIKMKENWDHLTVVELYVGAIRLYDTGYRDEAVYWFYSAQYRARLFQASIIKPENNTIGNPAFEIIQAYNSFYQLSGVYINAYAFNDLDKLSKIIVQVTKESEKLLDLSKIYSQFTFAEANKQKENIKILNEGLEKLSRMIIEKKEEIKQNRVEAGIDDKINKLEKKDFVKLKEK